MRRTFSFLLLALVGCAPLDHPPITGKASLAFDCPVYEPGVSPPAYGNGVARVELAGQATLLAQGATAFAVDGGGNRTSDPTQAAYFTAQVFQDLSPTKVEVFEVRVLPDHWQPGTIHLDGINALGILSIVEVSGSGQTGVATIEAQTTGGALHLTAAGTSPGAAVTGSAGALGLESPAF